MPARSLGMLAPQFQWSQYLHNAVLVCVFPTSVQVATARDPGIGDSPYRDIGSIPMEKTGCALIVSRWGDCYS